MHVRMCGVNATHLFKRQCFILVMIPYRLVLRITADDPTALLSLSGGKFGCSVSAGKELVTTASQLGLSVVGVR